VIAEQSPRKSNSKTSLRTASSPDTNLYARFAGHAERRAPISSPCMSLVKQAGSFRCAASIAISPYFRWPTKVSPAPHQGISASVPVVMLRGDHTASQFHLDDWECRDLLHGGRAGYCHGVVCAEMAYRSGLAI
jgi:hypothetical protein